MQDLTNTIAYLTEAGARLLLGDAALAGLPVVPTDATRNAAGELFYEVYEYGSGARLGGIVTHDCLTPTPPAKAAWLAALMAYDRRARKLGRAPGGHADIVRLLATPAPAPRTAPERAADLPGPLRGTPVPDITTLVTTATATEGPHMEMFTVRHLGFHLAREAAGRLGPLAVEAGIKQHQGMADTREVYFRVGRGGRLLFERFEIVEREVASPLLELAAACCREPGDGSAQAGQPIYSVEVALVEAAFLPDHTATADAAARRARNYLARVVEALSDWHHNVAAGTADAVALLGRVQQRLRGEPSDN